MKALLAAAVLAICALPASQAAAVDYTLTYSGVLSAGEDALGLFGPAVQPGDPMSLAFIYDPDLGLRTTDQGVFDELDTYGAFTAQGVSRIVFTLDGVSYSYTPDIQADVSVGAGLFDLTDPPAFDGFGAAASGMSLGGESAGALMDVAPASPLFTSLTRTGTMIGDGVGYFDTAFNADGESDNFIFEPLAVTISAAPEPSVWTLMITGVGALGFALRRGRRRRSWGRPLALPGARI